MPQGRALLAALASSALVVSALVVSATPAAAADATTSDARSADDTATAQVIATTYGHEVTVDGATTPTELVTAMPDGSMTLTEDSLPVRTEQDGDWVPVDPTLRSDGDWLSPAATDTHVRFSRGGDDALAQVRTDSGNWVTETWPDGGALPVPRVDGATATYEDVLPDVDLRLTATASGMSEVLVVQSAEAAVDPDLQQVELELHGATLSTTQTGSTATTADGSTLTSSTPTWWDSSHGGDASGPGGAGSPRPVEHDAQADTLTLDVAAVTAASPQYPVYVDPDWSAGQNAFWFDDNAYPTQSYLNGQYSAGYQSVGYAVQDGRTYMSRAFWQFSTSALAGKTITSAHFNAVATYSCGSNNIQAWRYGVVGAGQNWNYDQANQGQWRDHISDAYVAGVSGCDMAGKSYGWDVTRGVQAVAGGTLQIGLRADNEGALSRKHFNQGASLTVEYNAAPNVPTGLTILAPTRACGTSVAGAAWVNNSAQDLVFAVNASDPDGGVMHTTYQVMRSTDPDTAVWSKASATTEGGRQSVTVPKKTLSNGSYMWRAKTNDGAQWGGWTGWCYFTADDKAPARPTVTVGSTHRVVGTPTTVTVSSKDTDVRGFEYFVSYDDGGSKTQPLSDAVGTATGYHDCTFEDGIVSYVCADANHSATITFAPQDTTSTLWVWAIDRAGNVSEQAATDDVDTTDGLDDDGVSADADPDPRVGSGTGTAGHVWTGLTDGAVTGNGTSGSPTVIADDRAAGGTGTSTRLPLTVDPSVSTSTPGDFPGQLGTTVLREPDLVRINRFNGSGGHRAAVSGSAPSGTHYESTLGEITSATATKPTGASTLTSCIGSWGDQTTTGSCPSGTTSKTVLGYSWGSAADVPPGATARQIWSCWSGTDWFDSSSSTCENHTVRASLGYFASLGPSTTAAAPVSTTQSYTVSAWMKLSAGAEGHSNTAVSIDGDTTSAFYLQYIGGTFRFCVKQQTDSPATDCATPTGVDYSTVPGNDTWYFVTGIWDAGNGEARILISASPSGSHAVAHALASGEKPVTGGLRVGGALSSGGPSDAFDGQIASPAITQGVASLEQLRLLMNQGTYGYAN